MILQALVQLYEELQNDPEAKKQVPPLGYSVVDVTFAINLSDDGEILDIFPLGQQEKKLRPVPLIVPEYSEPTSNVQPSFLCGKSDYVLGISAKDKDKPGHSQKRFQAFKEFHYGLLSTVQFEAARAVVKFLHKHKPISSRNHPVIQPYLKELERGRRLIFQFRGRFIHDEPEMRKIWESYYFNEEQETKMQCLVTGQVAPVAVRHRKINSRVERQYISSPLISFNQRAFESYGRNEQQGLNAPVSRQAEAAYTRALNYLLSDQYPYEKPQIGDAITVYWSEKENENYSALYAAILDPSSADTVLSSIRNSSILHTIESVLQKISKGEPIAVSDVLDEITNSPKFYILGIAPVGEGRWQLRFFIEDTFDNIIKAILQHYEDASIVSANPTTPTIKRIAATSIPVTASNEQTKRRHRRNIAPAITSTFQAISRGSPYPVSLYNILLNRIKAERYIPDIRVAIIKAYLLRKYRHHPIHPFKEVLNMSLNEASTNPAYVLGRLFAVLEKAQKEAIPGIDATIKDKYFTSACATPASVFPVLMRLAHHWTSKAEYGYVAERQIQELMALLDAQSFPRRFTLDEQGVFILGYYHQRAAFYAKKKNNQTDKSQTEKEN